MQPIWISKSACSSGTGIACARTTTCKGWKRGRIYADFIFTLRPDEPGAGDGIPSVFVAETKGLHLKQYTDTDYKRSVFDICSEHASKKDWAEFVPAMRGKVMRFEIAMKTNGSSG